MRNHTCIFVLLLFTIPSFCFAQLSIHIHSLPSSTPQDAEIFLAGNMNGWNPGDVNYKLNLLSDGDYWIDLPEVSGQMEFKFTRGSWETVEGNEIGAGISNRIYTQGDADTLHLSILGWEDIEGGGAATVSTADEQVRIWDSAMYMPQLDRYRRIWVYLPQDYETSTKSYRVLYMHDGQNVFDASTSYAGEWMVDETLTDLENQGHETAIVVAIDNGALHRMDEYSPFKNSQYGGGEGDAYLDFIIETLKPKIDTQFRTLKGPENTGIMGSSMGGLISHYAYFRNPEVFGKSGIFSPSYWFSKEYYSYTTSRGKTGSPRIYLLAGALEPGLIKSIQGMKDAMMKAGFLSSDLKIVVEADGQHSEWFWAREFKDAFLWLFNSEEVSNIQNLK